jgi:hypothetical protein
MWPEQSLIFLHIPKTGGSTLRSIIARQYPPNTIFTIRIPSPEGIEEFKRLPEAKRAEIAALQGHMGFGLHQWLPKPSTYFTILRDPVDRVISRYHYESSKSPTPAYMYRENDVASRPLTLEEYVCSGVGKLVDNGQTRLLSASSGEIYNDVDFGQCSKEMLKRAKMNLQRHFVIFSTLERFDHSLILLRRSLGWGFPLYVRKRVTKGHPRRRDISNRALRIIKELNAFDIELYNWVKERQEEQIAKQGISFHMELILFRLLKGSCASIYALIEKP